MNIRSRLKKFGALAVLTAVFAVNTTAMAANTTMLYPVNDSLIVGEGQEVTTIERESLIGKKKELAIKPAEHKELTKIQDQTSDFATGTFGSAQFVTTLEGDGDGGTTIESTTTEIPSFVLDYYQTKYEKFGTLNTTPIVAARATGKFYMPDYNGRTMQIQNLTLSETKIYNVFLRYTIYTEDGKHSTVVTNGKKITDIDYNKGILNINEVVDPSGTWTDGTDFTVKTVHDVSYFIYEMTPSVTEGEGGAFIEVSTSDAKWIKESGARFKMTPRITQHPANITVPSYADIRYVPDKLNITYYYNGQAVFSGKIPVKKVTSDNKPIVSDGILSTGMITYDSLGDGTPDVVIDSRDILALHDKISSINHKWTVNYENEDEGLLDNFYKVNETMGDIEDLLSVYEWNTRW